MKGQRKGPGERRTFPATHPRARRSQSRTLSLVSYQDAQRKRSILKVGKRPKKKTALISQREKDERDTQRSRSTEKLGYFISSVDNVQNPTLVCFHPLFPFHLPPFFRFLQSGVWTGETEKSRISTGGPFRSDVGRGEAELKKTRGGAAMGHQREEQWDFKEKMESKCRRKKTE